MMASTHLLFGVAATALLGKAGAIEVTPVVLVSGALGSLLPDIDHPGSTMGRRVLPISLLISGIFGHRGITHSLLAVVGLSAATWFYLSSLPSWGIAVIVGYLSHLFADWLTPSGIPLLWPRRDKFSSPFTIQTGGAMEFALSIGMVGGLMWMR